MVASKMPIQIEAENIMSQWEIYPHEWMAALMEVCANGDEIYSFVVFALRGASYTRDEAVNLYGSLSREFSNAAFSAWESGRNMASSVLTGDQALYKNSAQKVNDRKYALMVALAALVIYLIPPDDSGTSLMRGTLIRSWMLNIIGLCPRKLNLKLRCCWRL